MSLSAEHDLVVVLWSNRSSANGRLFETITRAGSRNPVVFSFSYLEKRFSSVLKGATVVSSEAEFRSWVSEIRLRDVSRDNPLIVPVPFVRIVLGWQNFDVWEPKKR